VGGICGTHRRGEERARVLMKMAEGKIPVGSLRRRRENGIRMDLREAGWGGVDSVGSGYGPVASSCKYGDEPSGTGAT
jgi:hypothetical protein